MSSNSFNQITLNDALSMYRFPFFSSNSSHEDLCRNVMNSKDYYKAVSQSMAVLIPEAVADQFNVNDIRNSIYYRYPVYFGKPVLNYFNDTKVEQLLDYSVNMVEKKLNTDIQFAICGRVLIASPDKSQPTNTQWAYVTHCWGVNLESNTTEDYKKYTKNNGLIRSAFQQRNQEMIRNILYSGLHACEDSNKTHCDILLPLIGMGAYLTALNEKDKEVALSCFINELSIQTNNPIFKNVHVHLCDFGERTRNYQAYQNSNFEIGYGPIDGDLFAMAKSYYTEISASKCFLVANAWDSCSFIGNGGSEDSTIDGMLVAGAHPGQLWPNSSYVHNSFLMPIILQQSSWQITSQSGINKFPLEQNERKLELPKTYINQVFQGTIRHLKSTIDDFWYIELQDKLQIKKHDWFDIVKYNTNEDCHNLITSLSADFKQSPFYKQQGDTELEYRIPINRILHIALPSDFSQWYIVDEDVTFKILDAKIQYYPQKPIKVSQLSPNIVHLVWFDIIVKFVDEKWNQLFDKSHLRPSIKIANYDAVRRT